MKYSKLKAMWFKKDLGYSYNFVIITERKATKCWNSYKFEYIKKLLTSGQAIRDKYCPSFRSEVAGKWDGDAGTERVKNEWKMNPQAPIKSGEQRRLFKLHPPRKYCKQATLHLDF